MLGLGIRDSVNLLREQLSPSGNVVSPKGRELTLKVFGEALSPTAVVERICAQVKKEGIKAHLITRSNSMVPNWTRPSCVCHKSGCVKLMRRLHQSSCSASAAFAKTF